MLLYGNSRNIPDNVVVFNLTSLKEGYRRLDLLIPPNQLGLYTGRDFDIAYANYIMSNDMVFKEFFDIIHCLYIGQDVYIIIDEEAEWSENITESLLKLIQQRYGYNASHISCFDDFVYACNNDISDFNPYFGVYNLDIDKQRYEYMCESMRLSSPGATLTPDLTLDTLLIKQARVL